ncbi:MAG: protein-L-isoaspartate(D-aspartate) O-methyltransferase [Gammaproteobacteria bacterium]|nr:MAG: protein-L-isoaspartate(D-aspartate) O-methyltransferase [Gammaproteobacteria bacterium]
MEQEGGQQAAEQLLREVEQEIRETARYTGVSGLSEAVKEALRTVPRDAFVPDGEQHAAWLNIPLPIGHGQTISQPYIVALMTELLQVGRESRVLEIGAGSGYQAAILSRIVAEVYTVEIVPALAERARKRLEALGYDNVHVRQGDGHLGWPEHAPYDGVIVTAAAPSIPTALVEQLREGHRMVIPIGRPWGPQVLTLLEKEAGGRIRSREVLPVAFVPMTGGGDAADR